MEHMVKFSIIVNFDKGISKDVPKQAPLIPLLVIIVLLAV